MGCGTGVHAGDFRRREQDKKTRKADPRTGPKGLKEVMTMIRGILEAIAKRREWNRIKRQLSENASSRAIINLVCSGALTMPQGKRLVKVGRPL